VSGELRKNWAGNYTFLARHLYEPGSIAELQEIVRTCDKVKAVGARHSFNEIADCAGGQISLKYFDKITLDRAAHTVQVGAGVTYARVAAYLYSEGYALHNLASLPHISVAGACSTGTHGSGNRTGNLATVVSALEIVTADGEVVTFSRDRDPEHFYGVVVGLGALGVVTSVTLDVQPRFDVAQAVYQDLAFGKLESHLDEIFSLGLSVSLFTEWRDRRVTQVWVKKTGDASFDPELFGARIASSKLHPIAGCPAESCTEQMGLPGPWQERLPHFKSEFTPSSGDELQSEYFVPRECAYEAILAVDELSDRITPLLFVSELRTIAADDLWMSPCYWRSSLAIHFTWKPDWAAVKQVLPMIEKKLAPFDARPHWAKLFTMTPAPSYERLPDFRKLIQHYDPTGKFQNDYLKSNLST
jgi:alditol oxidase